MNKTTSTIGKLTALLIIAYGLFAFGSYDASHELAVLTPNHVDATLSFTTPELEVPELSEPPELEVPEIDTPELDVPDLDVPELDTPEHDTSEYTYSKCKVYASVDNVDSGGQVTISWETEGYSTFTLNGVGVSGPNGQTTFKNITENTTYTLIATSDDGDSTCTSTVTVGCIPPYEPKYPTCDIWPASQTIEYGEKATLSWETENAYNVYLSTFGEVDKNNTNFQTGALYEDTTYILTAKKGHKEVECEAEVYVESPKPACQLLPPTQTIAVGDRATLSWTTENAESVTLTNFGTVADTGTNVQTDPINVDTTFILEVTGYGQTEQCESVVYVTQPQLPRCDTFTAEPSTIDEDESSLLKWQTTNATRVVINNGIGEVDVDGTKLVTPAENIKYILTAYDEVNDSHECEVDITVNKVENTLPECTDFSADTYTLPADGGNVELKWTTVRATEITINPTVGTAPLPTSGLASVNVIEDTIFTLTAKDDDGDVDNHCQITIDVEDVEDTTPECTLFEADKTTLPADGGEIELTWQTLNATTVNITPLLGDVALSDSDKVTVTENTTFVLTATDDDGDTDTSCEITIDVEEDVPTPISCAANVDFRTSDSNIDEGDEVTLTWSTNGGINSVSINNGITSTALSGSESIRLNNDTTFTLTASDGTDTVSCPLSINVDPGGGGGGGGSSSPRCELEISDRNIRRGEEIELTWNTRLTSDIRLYDDHGETYVDTDDYLSGDKDEFFDGEITLKPDRDTEYTLIAERGRRERECTVSVNVTDDITVLQVRDQQPLVAGISLTQVPYTGFEAGPILTTIFYILLGLWAAFIAYVLVIRRESLVGISLPQNVQATTLTTEQGSMPDLFTASTVAEPEAAIPSNLPTGLPVAQATPTVAAPSVVTEIEDFAHAQHTLLSSDAITFFINSHTNEATRLDTLREIITTAKNNFPTEDGWLVLNADRMRQLARAEKYVSDDAPVGYGTVSVPSGSGSLAEAITTGNVVAAYELIGNRPMIALADAATDLDNLLRKKHGEDVPVSALLASADLTVDQLKGAINALTCAIDGTYTDEAAAVKMAILKATKALS